MIPIKITMNNFMSYGESLEALDFSNIELACLVGANGVGKSSILESIAWSLWGKSRAKSDDDLVKQGKSDMWVDFEFNLGGDKYRVVRKRTKKNKGQSNLEFYKEHNSNDKNEWVSISGGTKAETQVTIIETLKMTYDTFINSAYLRQGMADEFTIKKPTERKKVLTEILNLSYYDRLAEKIKDEARRLIIENESFNKQMEYIELEIKDKKELDDKAKKMKAELGSLEKNLKEIDDELKALNQKKELYDKRINQASFLDEKIKSISSDLEKINIDITESHDSIERDKKYLTDEDEINRSYKKLIRLRNRDIKYSELLKIKSEIHIDRNETEKNILSKKSEVLLKKSKLEYKINEIDKNIATEKEFEELYQNSLSDLDSLDKIERIKNELEDNYIIVSAEGNKFEAELTQIEVRGKEFKKKIIELKKIQGSNCPLCKQELSHDHKDEVLNDLKNSKEKEAYNYISVKSKIKKSEKRELDLSKKIKQYSKELKIKPELMGKIAMIKNKLEEFEKNKNEKAELEELLKDINSKLNTGTYDKGSHHKLEEIIKRLKNLKYNDKKHQDIKDGIIKLNEYEEKKNKLENIKSSIKQQEEFLSKLIKNRIVKEKELQKSKERRNKIKVDYDKIEDIEKNISYKNEKILKVRSDINQKQSSFGAIKEKVERAMALEKDLKDNKKNQIKINNEKYIVEELSKAFGKNGIQSMIIEAAVPEIEEDANNILSKMTDGKMRVQLKTKKEKKTDGDLIDTLDILIEDEQGIRNYEMFSGGEAYRINFAIRIALSKLMANRTGAKLQFLVIDEGFGTQDVDGRENLIQAINSISDDFKKILVITHIQELKDVFPSRIDVTKDESGSRFEVVA